MVECDVHHTGSVFLTNATIERSPMGVAPTRSGDRKGAKPEATSAAINVRLGFGYRSFEVGRADGSFAPKTDVGPDGGRDR